MPAAGSRLERERLRLLAVDMLRAARGFYSLRSLSRVTGVDPSVLSRYAGGHVIPGYEAAVSLIESLRRGVDLAGLVLAAAESPGGIIDLGRALSDHRILRLLSIEFYMRFRGSRIDKVLVPEASGVPLAASLGQLLEVDVVIARKTKGDPSREYYEAHVSAPPSIHRIYYVPRDLLSRGDHVLVVDDLVQSGYTLAAVRRLVEKAGGVLAGVAAVVVVGSKWRSVAGVDNVEAIVRMDL